MGSSFFFFSVLCDGTTDKGVLEQEVMYVRYVDTFGSIKTVMVDCVAVESADTVRVLAGIDKTAIYWDRY